MELVEGGATAVQGNHDAAIGTPTGRMHEEATAVIDWTRGELGAEQRRFWQSAAYRHRAGPALCARGCQRTGKVDLCADGRGGVTQPALDRGANRVLRPHPQGAVQRHRARQDDRLRSRDRRGHSLARARRWQAVLGSVGQPHNGIPAAAYASSTRTKKRYLSLRVPLRYSGSCHGNPQSAPTAHSRKAVRGEIKLDGKARFAARQHVRWLPYRGADSSGGIARNWTVSKPGIDMPLLMKVPILGEGGDPAAIVSSRSSE